MEEGLLWADHGIGELVFKVGEAARAYENKVGVRPNCCHVHAAMLPEEITKGEAQGLVIIADARVLPGELWLGIAEEEECPDGLAQGPAAASSSSNGGG